MRSDYSTTNITNTHSEDEEANISGEILVMMLLTFIALSGGHLLKKHKIKYINEPLFATFIGLVAGWILIETSNEEYINEITSGFVKFFLILLLPPIIFESAYTTRRKEFFKNFGTILIFAIFGTLISILFIGVFMWTISLTGLYQTFTLKESLAYGSIISATDPVSIISTLKEFTTEPNFFQIVFGESILNDAVAIVFYETCVKYNKAESLTSNTFESFGYFLVVILGSTLIGLVVGFLTALSLKMVSGKVQNIEKIEMSLMVILPLVSYLIAQMLGLSGIVSILFNGIAHATYTKPNLTDWSKITIRNAYEGIANIFETLVFIFLGIGFFAFQHPFERLSFLFVIIMLSLIATGRFINIGICSIIANFSRSQRVITPRKQFFLWFAGVRGAMAFALSIKSKIDFPQSGPTFLMLTLIVSTLTIVYSSLFTNWAIRKCDLIEIQADNFDDCQLNKKMNCFDLLKHHVQRLNDNYLMKCVRREDKSSSSQTTRPNNHPNQSDNNKEVLPVETETRTSEIKQSFPYQDRSDYVTKQKLAKDNNINLIEMD